MKIQVAGNKIIFINYIFLLQLMQFIEKELFYFLNRVNQS